MASRHMGRLTLRREQLAPLQLPPQLLFFCDGEGTAEQVVRTYRTFVANWNVGSSGDRPFNLTDDDVQLFQDCAGFEELPDRAWIDFNQQYGGGKPNRFSPEIIALEQAPGYDPAAYCVANASKCLPAEFDGPDMVPPTSLANPILFPTGKLAQTAFNKYNIFVE